jgi:hypothetical protein
MKYGVIICPSCNSGKIIEQKYETTICIRCGKRLTVKKITILYETNTLENAQQYLGKLNAEKDGRLDVFNNFLTK